MRRIDTRRPGHAARALLRGRTRILAAALAVVLAGALASVSPTALLVALLVVLITGAVVGGAIAMVDRRTRAVVDDAAHPLRYANADRLTRRVA